LARVVIFTRGFLEPTVALAVPAFIGKAGDFLFKLIVTTVKTPI
jgi:hypothetical protein